MRVRLLRNWGQYPKDRIIEPPAGQAQMLVFRNIAIRVSETDEPEPPTKTKKGATSTEEDGMSYVPMIDKFKVTTDPTVEPLSVSDMNAHLRLDVNNEDGLVSSLIVAARKYVEMFTRRALITRTYTGRMDCFPANRIRIPFAPVQSITSIAYLDTAGDSQTLATSVYDLDIAAEEEAHIFLKYEQTYPATRDIDNAITIVWVSGHGDAATDVPADALHAMRLLVGHWFMSREAVIVGTISGEIEFAVQALLWGLRLE